MKNQQFTIPGQSIFYRFFNWRFNRATKRAEKLKAKRDQYDDKTFDITDVYFHSPYILIIKYKILQTNARHQIVLENNFREQYKYYSEHKELPESIKLQTVISHHHKNSLKLN
jgi:hypothetical protein